MSNAIGGFQSIFQATGGSGALGRSHCCRNKRRYQRPSAAAHRRSACCDRCQRAAAIRWRHWRRGAAAALPAAAFGDGIKSLYNAIEPWVAYGFDLASYAAGWVPYIGWIVAPQIQFFYNWIEPMVQSGLFNILDWLGGSISFSQGLNNFLNVAWNETWQFFYDEFYWVFGSILPPLPPLPPWPF